MYEGHISTIVIIIIFYANLEILNRNLRFNLYGIIYLELLSWLSNLTYFTHKSFINYSLSQLEHQLVYFASNYDNDLLYVLF